MKETRKYFRASDESVHKKFEMFRRLDGHNWSKFRLFIGALLFLWIKLAGVLFSVILCYCLLKIILFNRKEVDEKLKRRILFIVSFSAKIFMLSIGVVVSEKEINYDYTKYLGKGYNGDTKTAAIISNHTSWLDIILYTSRVGAGYIASIHVKSFPLIGYIATALGCIFVDRNDKTHRNNSLAIVNEKLTNIYNNKDYSVFAIFPEGTTTNNTCILPFKKGAFISKLPLKPFVIKFETRENISLAMDCIEMLLHILVILCIPIHKIELYSLPVFCPNEYFFKVYNKDNKEDWQIYADTMRDIMSEVSGLHKARGSWDSKREYLDFLRKSKNN